MRELFNFSLGGNETTPNINEESATLSIFLCVCVCVKQCVFKIKKKKLETMCWKNQPKKTMHKTMNFGLTNWLNQKRNLGIQQNVTIFLQYLYF